MRGFVFVMLWLLPGWLAAQRLLWELPPLLYSETPAGDPVAALAEKGFRMEGNTQTDRLRSLLRALDIPEASQVLVFSKTSHQNPLIHPRQPRALYFSENAYVGFVPGGMLEVAIQDPRLGMVFYLIENEPGVDFAPLRDHGTCISCHGTGRTEHAPGVLVRSVFPAADGQPLLAHGSHDVHHETPLPQRWGGYYVTGRSSLPHLGNATFRENESPRPQVHSLDDLSGRIDTSRYLRPTSDIVALLVLEHQCRMHNLLNAASLEYRRASHLAQAIDPAADPDAGAVGRLAEDWARRITACLLFENEADPGDELEGDPAFQDAFTARFPRSAAGDSLADFRLHGRLFKFPCSYMIHSSAFHSLPAPLRQRVYNRIGEALDGNAPHGPRIAAPQRAKIRAILAETLPDWPPA